MGGSSLQGVTQVFGAIRESLGITGCHEHDLVNNDALFPEVAWDIERFRGFYCQ
jgi:hypothetical protein